MGLQNQVEASPIRAADSGSTRIRQTELRILMRAFERLDALALGFAVGVTSGAALAIATLWLVIKGGEEVGMTLSLVRSYFPGFNASPAGALLGFVYAFVAGFCGGWVYASLWNLSRRLYVGWLLTKQILTSGFLDNV